MQTIHATATFDLATASLLPDSPVHCEACGSRVTTISPILVIDRLRDAADYCDGMEIVPQSVRVQDTGSVEFELDLATFQRITESMGLTVTTRDRTDLGLRFHYAQDKHFRLVAMVDLPKVATAH